jgi:hypothetical protein
MNESNDIRSGSSAVIPVGEDGCRPDADYTVPGWYLGTSQMTYRGTFWGGLV